MCEMVKAAPFEVPPFTEHYQFSPEVVDSVTEGFERVRSFKSHQAFLEAMRVPEAGLYTAPGLSPR